MSEAEILRRQEYKKNRKKWMTIQGIAIAVALLIALCSFLVWNKLNKSYEVEYRQNGNVDYFVTYVDNGFFADENEPDNNAYVSSLIEGITAKFKYDLDVGADNIGFDYTYRINATLLVADQDTGRAILHPVEPLIEEKSVSVKDGNDVRVNETVTIDYVKYNTHAVNFIDTYGLSNVTSTLVVTLEVDLTSECSNLAESMASTYTTSLNIPLTKQVVNIESTSSIPDGQTSTLLCSAKVNPYFFFILGIVFGVFAAIVACVLFVFSQLTKNDDITYASRVRKIVSAYRSFIQQIDGEFDATGYQIVTIKTFTEMLGIRDTIQSPILMSENRDETRTRFHIPTSTKLLYTFDVKVDNYDELYGEDDTYLYPEYENDYAPVNAYYGDEFVIPSENLFCEDAPLDELYAIDNGFVYTTETEQAHIVAEDVDTEALAEAMAAPDVTIEEVEFVPDNDEDYDGTDENPGIEVVGVVWPDKAHKSKVYRYDPNGEKLSEGDMVLVPTRDVAKNREIIRKAAIAHGNHRIDPELIKHPLKKIIGVIKRKTEKALTPQANAAAEKAAEEKSENEAVLDTGANSEPESNLWTAIEKNKDKN